MGTANDIGNLSSVGKMLTGAEQAAFAPTALGPGVACR